MNYIELGKVAHIEREVASEEDCERLPYVGLEHIEKDTGSFVEGFSAVPDKLLATKFRFNERHVLYGKLRPYLNKVTKPTFDGVCTTEILPIRPIDSKLDRTYLWAYLLSNHFVEWASLNVSGAQLPRISPKKFVEHLIPYPPLPEQNRIAAILSKADRLRRPRRYARKLSETFLQSVFLEMFGDPILNPKGWEVVRIGDIVSSSQYGTSQRSNSEMIGYPIIGMGNITENGKLDLSSLAYVDLSPTEFGKLKLEKGDVIFNRTNSTELVGKTTLWSIDIDAVLASYLVKIRLTDEILPTYFVGMLNTSSYKQLLQLRCRKAVGQSNISPTLLKEFDIPLPPLANQEAYHDSVSAFEEIYGYHLEATRQGGQLFQSLLHRAFRGEL